MHIAINTSIRPVGETSDKGAVYVAVAMQRDHPDYEDYRNHKNCIIGRAWAETPSLAVTKLLPKIEDWMENPNQVELPLEEFKAREQRKTRNMP